MLGAMVWVIYEAVIDLGEQSCPSIYTSLELCVTSGVPRSANPQWQCCGPSSTNDPSPLRDEYDNTKNPQEMSTGYTHDPSVLRLGMTH
jgi:hypothetical protein